LLNTEKRTRKFEGGQERESLLLSLGALWGSRFLEGKEEEFPSRPRPLKKYVKILGTRFSRTIMTGAGKRRASLLMNQTNGPKGKFVYKGETTTTSENGLQQKGETKPINAGKRGGRQSYARVEGKEKAQAASMPKG